MEIRKYYDKKPSKGIKFTQETMAQQQFKEECDINNIVARYETTGLLTDPTKPGRAFQFGDYANLPDYMEAQELIRKAGEQFAGLPASIRKEFDNNPALFLDFCANSENHDRAIELGLIDGETKPPILVPDPKTEDIS